MTGGPFVCTPNFYEDAASYLWRFDAVTQKYVAVNSVAQAADLNPIGYDAQNNYIYGVSGSGLYQIGSRKRDRHRDPDQRFWDQR